MTLIADSKQPWLNLFTRREMNGALAGLRRQAAVRFETLGFPTDRDEAWRFTDITPIVQTVFQPLHEPPGIENLRPFAQGPLQSCQLTFLDGLFEPSLSKLHFGENPAHPDVRMRAEHPLVGQIARFDAHPFAALNTALFQDGAFIRIPAHTHLKHPIHLLFLSSARPTPFVTFPRVLILAEEGVHASIVESYLGPTGGVYFTNAVTELVLGDHAVLDHTKVQRESPKAYHVATLWAKQGRNSCLTSHSISLGAAIARNDIGTVLEGEGAECTLNGLYEATGTQRVDHHTTIDHAQPHGTSRELYKGILSGQAHGVFDGKIVVRQDAQKTNAMQTNKNLLLSEEALVHTKPQLEIFANDVKCKHGATIGQLDRDMLFYMRSRGIPFEEARRLLIHAFASEIIDEVGLDAIRQQLGACLHFLAEPARGEPR